MSTLLWLDLETEGLNSRNDSIIEVAWAITFEDLTVLGAGSAFVDLPAISLTPEVAAMHAQSGLIAAWGGAQTRSPLLAIEQQILVDIGKHEIDLKVPVYLAGSGVHFDREFIKVWMKRLHERLHYRIIDVSQSERFVRDLCGVEIPSVEFKGNAHRALDDVMHAIARARALQEVLS